MDRTALIACASLLVSCGVAFANAEESRAPTPTGSVPALLDPRAIASQPCRPLVSKLANWPTLGAAGGRVTLLSDQGHSTAASPADVSRSNVPGQIAPDVDAERMQLPWAAAGRTPEMIAAVRRANQRVRGGFARAERGALYSARSEFTTALQTIAQASDVERQTRRYTKSLELGLAALREAGDFLGRNAVDGDAPVAQLVSRHQTAILKGSDQHDLAAHEAAERYCAFAREQLAAAVFGEPTGSMALFGLAKVAQVSAAVEPGRSIERRLQAEHLFRAALLAERNNFCAANELAVLLAETGHLEESRALLVQSVSAMPHAVTWRNLAGIHDRLGENQLAQQARAQADLLPHAVASGSAPAVEWIDAASFARLTSASDAVMPGPPIAQIQNATPRAPSDAALAPVTTAKKPTDRYRWSPRR
ncbi:MAG: hypothetical protein WD845_13995 [Pirellulales bacterium]